MAGLEWTRTAPRADRRPLPAWAERLWQRYFDWEDWLTLALTVGATMSVSVTLEAGGWSKEMPALTLVSVIALVSALFLARSRLPLVLAWPGALLAGGLVVFWQALAMVGPGSLSQRLDSLYTRFDIWLQAAFNSGVSNDSLPFHVLVLSITWLGVFLFGWSVFRWSNAWIGLIPGGIALFLDLAFVGDSLGGAALVYYLFGFLLVMRTSLLKRMQAWRQEATPYPQLISFTFLNFSFWALLVLIIAAWIAPVGPFRTPSFVQSAAIKVEDIGVDFIRLAGPLRSNKIIPIHNYTEVLPFQGSVRLGDREVLAVKVNNGELQGPFALRGTVYENYDAGGWQAGPREQSDLSPYLVEQVDSRLEEGSAEGDVVPISVEVLTKTISGSVFFSVGEPITVSRPATATSPEASLRLFEVELPDGGRSLADQEVIKEHLPPYLMGLRVQRDDWGRVQYVEAFDTRDQAVPDTTVIRPNGRLSKGAFYSLTGFLQQATADDLRAAGRGYPMWVRHLYAQLPGDLPRRIPYHAHDVVVQQLEAAGKLPAKEDTGYRRSYDLNGVAPYDIAKAIEAYLREFPVDYSVEDTPPGRDTVDYFLFDARRGYFDYHASAMVVMLRSLDIPSRLAVGYVADEEDFDKDRNAYVIRDRNTYAWPEVYFPGYGWVMFNPSPDRPESLYPQPRLDGDSSSGADLSHFPGLPAGADPIFPTDDDVIKVPPGPTAIATSGGGGTSYTTTILAIAGAFALLLATSAALGWRRAAAGLPLEDQTWDKFVRLSSWAGYPPEPGQTPHDFANAMQKRLRNLRGVSVVAAAYTRARFGRHQATAEERRRIEELWPHIRGPLLKAIGLRIVRRGGTAPPDYPH